MKEINFAREDAIDHSKHIRLTTDELVSSRSKAQPSMLRMMRRSVPSLMFTGTARPAQVVIDVGRFLGVGTTRIAVPSSDLDFMRDESGDVHAVTTWTKDQLKAIPERHD